MKEWLEKFELKILMTRGNLNSKSLKTGFVIGFGILLVAWGSIFIFTSMSNQESYRSIVTENDKALVQLDEASKNKKKMLLVLYRHDCKYCKNVEKPLVKRIHDLKPESYLVIDIQNMNKKELKRLSKTIPDIIVDGDKIPTPLVAEIKGDGGNKLDVLKKSDSDDMNEISRVISKEVSDT